MDIQDIEQYVQGELSYLNLSTKEQERIIKYITYLDYHYHKNNKKEINTISFFLNKLEDCNEFFKIQGFNEEKSIELAKKCVISYDNKNFKEKLAFLRINNMEESTIINDPLSIRFNLEKAHAKKMFLVNNNDKISQTRNFLIHTNDSDVQRRFNVRINDLLKQFPLTKETLEVFMIIATMNNQQFKNYFNMSREQLCYIYPTTKDELATLHFIAKMKDNEIKEKYGLTRNELLEKYPLNNDTLKALRSINQSSDKTIVNTFNKSRNEILNLRTITTNMIKIAQQEKLILKRQLAKQELLEQFKAMKKGTYPNG